MKDFYPNTIDPKPKHGERGEHRIFKENEVSEYGLTYFSSEREGNDIYCSNCDNWNTVKGTSILFSIVGECKNCGADLNPERK